MKTDFQSLISELSSENLLLMSDVFSRITDSLQNLDRTIFGLAIDGAMASGKSHQGRLIAAAFPGKSLILPTEWFIQVERREWSTKIASKDLNLENWYDFDRLLEVVETIRSRQKFKLEGLYDVESGRIQKRVEIDAQGCQLLIIEGLFAFSDRLLPITDCRLLTAPDEKLMASRALERAADESKLSPEETAMHRLIFKDHYQPKIQELEAKADITYTF